MLMVCGHYKRFTEEELASCGCGNQTDTHTTGANSPYNMDTTLDYNLHNIAKCTHTYMI